MLPNKKPFLILLLMNFERKLKRNTDVVIREGDKGSAVIMMSRDRYIAEVYRQLSDRDVYQHVFNNVFV